jgi:uncharacterized protein (TIGR03437 family)
MWFAAVVVPAAAQTSNTVTRVDTNPPGGIFFIDNSEYSGATSAIWPIYSKHVLSVPGSTQDLGQKGVLATFTGWSWAGGTGAVNTQYLTVTADPSITEYTANFSVSFALIVDCADGTGAVLANGQPTGCGGQMYVPKGTILSLTASPASGYVFGGWMPGPNQSIHGATDMVTMNAPVHVSPMFQAAREVDLATVPAGLLMLVDSIQAQTPYTAQWGAGSVHSLYPVSPQQDTFGAWWVCPVNSCAVPAYTVPAGSNPISLTTTFVPGVPMGFYTSPAGLTLTVDNRSNWTSYSFIWGVGETHTVSAPSQQTDSQGRLWAFSGWSNGGAATQTVTVPDGTPGGVKYIATYAPMGHVTVNSLVAGLSITVDGSACALPCDIVRSPGTQVAISAPKAVPVGTGSRQDFLGWSNGATGDLLLTLGSDPLTLSANYHVMNLLAANSSPVGYATLNMQPASPDGYYDAASTVSVSVAPQPGFKFRLWSGDLNGTSPTATIGMSVPRAIQAILDKVPYVAPSAVTNAAGGSASMVAPGSVVSIFGVNLAQGTVVGPSSPLAQTLGGLTVHIGDRLLPLFFVSPTQVNAQLPSDFTPGQQTVTISAPGQPDVQTSVTIAADAPGLFQQPVNGQSMAVAFHADGSAVTSDSPAQQGETITIYGTGFGPATPARPEGLPVASSPVVALTDPISVQVGGAQCAVQNAFAVPGAIGLDAVQCTLGTGSADGTLTVTINGQQSNTVTLPMQ